MKIVGIPVLGDGLLYLLARCLLRLEDDYLFSLAVEACPKLSLVGGILAARG